MTHVHARRTTWRALGLEFAHEPRVDLRDLDLSRAENLDLLAAWAHARPTLLVLSPTGPARRAPGPDDLCSPRPSRLPILQAGWGKL